MRSIIVLLIFLYSFNSIAEDFTQSFYCDINAIQTKDFSEDMLGYVQSDYESVFPKWLSKAKAGERKYQFYVAKAYYFGQGVSQNYNQSLEWFKKSANQGYPIAKNNLAVIYSEGNLVEYDPEKAFQLFCEASRDGFIISTRGIAFFYAQILQDFDKTILWLTKAAEQEDSEAQAYLGRAYLEGDGPITIDYKLALYWLSKAAKQGNATAQINLGWMYANGHGVTQDNKLAVSWYKKSAEQGNSMAQNNLGLMYANGHGVTQDNKLAVSWFKKSAEQGNSMAQNNLGLMYANGHGVTQDNKLAVSWFKKSAEQGDIDGQYNLGVMYANGHGVTQDNKLAVSWFKKSAEQGNSMAQNNLGLMYANGHGVTQDNKLAVSWFKKSAEQGDIDGQYNLGVMYANGHGFTQDNKLAVSWYIKAAEQGNTMAIQEVGLMLLNKEDLSSAIDWFKRGIEAGNNESAFSLGLEYSNKESQYYDIQLAIKYLEIAYELGHRDAPTLLGTFYNWGPEGLEQDIQKAEYWYLKSAKEYDDASSQSFLANIYSQPSVWPEMHDEQKSFYWAKKSADQGNLLGMDYLATRYAWGFGTKQSGEMAIKTYKDIIKKDDWSYSMKSLRIIGDIYAFGRTEISRDYQEAKNYYLQAESMGDKESQNLLGIIYVALGDYESAKKWFSKSGTEDSMSSILTINNAFEGDADAEYDLAIMISRFDERDEVNELYESAALRGSVEAQAELGINYTSGIGVEANQQVALYWLKKAAQQGNAMAQNNLGVLYHNGTGVNKDIDQALYWYTLAAEQNYPLSFRNLGSIYLVEFNDAEKAIKYYKLAIEHKDYAAAWDLAYLYEEGKAGVEVNEKLAFKWMLLGAEHFNKYAQFRVSRMYLDGYGTEVDVVESTIWLIRAFNQPVFEVDPKWIHEEIKKELAFRYYWGIGLEGSLQKAKEYDLDYVLETLGEYAIKANDVTVILNIAEEYRFKEDNIKKSIYWYQKAAYLGNPYAQRTMGLLYSLHATAAGLIPDFKKGEFWFLEAIEQGDIDSLAYLAEMYYDEYETPGVKSKFYDPSKSFELLVKAKESGSNSYHSGLQYLYEFGIGVEKDLDKALLITKDKLNKLAEWEESYWYITMWYLQIQRENPDKAEISRSMTYFIERAQLGDIGDTNVLIDMYLEEDFEYYDEKEAFYWLNLIKSSSFNANVTLSSYADTYSKYGDYLRKAIELYETGEVKDYIPENSLIETYSNLIGYYRAVGANEKVESLLRHLSQLIPDKESSYWVIQNMSLAGISKEIEISASYLEDQIKVLKNKTDPPSLALRWTALSNLHMKYRNEKNYEKSVNLAIETYEDINKYEIDNNFLGQQIDVLNLIVRDYLMLGEVKKAENYFSIMRDKITIGESEEYNEKHDKGVRIQKVLKLVWRDIFDSIIKINNGNLDEGFIGLNYTLDQVRDSEIPLRRQDLDFALMPLNYFTKEGEYDKASILLSKVVFLYQQNIENRIKFKSLMSSDEKNNIRDSISEYIYISSKSNNDLNDRGFEVMQLASGLTLSDTVIKSISNKELSGTLLVKSRLLEKLNKERRNLIEEKFMKLDSGFDTLKKIDNKLNDLDKQINSLESDLDGKLGDTLTKFITPAFEVQENLSNNDALITMLFSNKRSYVWLTTKEGVFRHDSEMTLKEVSEHAQRLIKSLNPAQMGKIAFPIDSSSKLYELLIAPFKEELEGIDRLIFSPDPILSQIPFSILTMSGIQDFDVVTDVDDLRGVASVKIISSDKSDNNQLENVDWLIEDFAIAIIPSVYSYVGLESSKDNENQAIDSFLGIGNPVLSGTEVILRSNEKVALSDQRGLISRTISDLSALPETETELKTIAKFFTNSLVITQNDATETKIRNMDLSGFDVIAFATHALLSNEIDDLFEPAIVLTPVDSDNSENDGLLMASEIAELSMNADIVLLSACNTASAFGESNSQGLSGIADSFFEAGAKSLLVSYWSVISDSAVDITTRMFDKSNTGKSYAHRHRESILQLLKESNNYQTNPVYWAPFMVIGVN